MFKRSTCAAAVMAVFSLAGTSAALAQQVHAQRVEGQTVHPVESPASQLPTYQEPQGQQPQGQQPHHFQTRRAPQGNTQMPENTQAPGNAQPPASTQQQPAGTQPPMAHAQEPAHTRPALNNRHAGGPKMVTATNMPATLGELTSDVVILPTYHAHQDVSQLTPFEPLGSIQTFSQGTPGAFGGLSIRGNAMQDTLVMIDGFRVSPASGADFSLLPMSYGSRTEILRGPGSAIYGQNAGGGVVQLLSDAAGPGTRASGEAGIGGRGYMQMRGRLSGGNDQITGRIDLGRERGDGFDATAGDYPGHQNDQDNWKRDNISGRLDARLSTATHLTVLAMRNTVNADFDGLRGSATALAAKKRLELAGVKAEHELSPGTRLDAKFGQSSISNTWNYTDGADWDKTKLREYGLGMSQRVLPNVNGRIAFERLEEGYDTQGLKSPTRTTNALLGNAIGTWGQHQLNLALRMDDSNRYNSTFSHQIGYGYRLAPNLRVAGNLSTGYRMPDLADYYASAEGNRLKQQRNQTMDAGAYWQPDSTTYAKAVVYRTRVHDRLTVAGDCTAAVNCSLFNLGRATITGMALSVGQDTAPGQAFDGLRWQANLDLVNPKNNATGRVLPHVAKRTLNGQVDYGFGDYSVGADLMLSNRRFSDEANQHRVGGALLVNLRSAWRVSPELTAYADVYNIGNRRNATWRYYNQQPRTVMLGVAYSPR